MRYVMALVLIVILLILGFQIYVFFRKGNGAAETYAELMLELAKARQEASESEKDLEYYLNPRNLEKELRARFNYRGQDEKMIILVPEAGPD